MTDYRTNLKSFMAIERLHDIDPDYYKKPYCKFAFVGKNYTGDQYVIENCSYEGYNETNDEYSFKSPNAYGGPDVVIKRATSGDSSSNIILKRQKFMNFSQRPLLLTVDNIVLNEETDDRYDRHLGGKSRRRKTRTKNRKRHKKRQSRR